MKKVARLFLLVGICALILSGCGKTKAENDEKLNIVVSVFPIYDWVSNIVSDNENISVDLLIKDGTDVHSYQPSVSDIVKISTADIFIYVGGESDEWVSKVLSTAGNENITVINLIEILGDAAKEEELVEGMEGDADGALDEHIWLSLRNARRLVGKISDEIIAAEKIEEASAKNELIKKNAEEYIEKLDSLDKEYEEFLSLVDEKTLLFGDRFPFRYFVDDYKLDYYAAFAGCEAETEASFETIAFLSEKVDELGLPAIFTLESSDGKIAEAIVDNSKNSSKIYKLDSMQSVREEEIDDGYSYVKAMESNLEILKKAFNK